MVNMHNYRYEGTDANGKKIKGTTEGTSRSICLRFLEQKNYTITKLEEYSNLMTKLNGLSFGRVVKPDVLVFFLKQLGSLLTAGVKLVDALELLAMQQDEKAVRKILFALYQEVYQGGKLSASLLLFPDDFPGVLVAMVEAGEATGDIGNTIKAAAEHFEKSQKTAKAITSVIKSPMIYLAITIVIMVGMLIFVFPTFEEMFAAFDAGALPFITQFYLDMSEFMQAYFLYIFLFIALVAAGFYCANRFSQKYREFMAKFKLKIPVMGKLNQMNNQILIANTLSQLMGRGVNAVQALEITKKVLKNLVYIDIIEQARSNVVEGRGFARAFEESWAIDPIMSRMINTGERTSEIPKLLKNLSGFYEEISDASIARTKAILQPMLLLVVYVVIGSLLIAIMLPELTVGANIGA